MDNNNTFQIPNTLERHVSDDVRRAIDEAFESSVRSIVNDAIVTDSFNEIITNEPEFKDPRYHFVEAEHGNFWFVKEIENRLDDYRKTALAIEAKKHPIRKKVMSLLIEPKDPLATFYDQEAVVAGNLMWKRLAKDPEWRRLNPVNKFRIVCEGHEWFFWNIDTVSTVSDETVHYQATDDRITKSFHGHIVPMQPGELENFLWVVQEYEREVVHNLYPFDEALTELMAPERFRTEAASKDDFTLAA